MTTSRKFVSNQVVRHLWRLLHRQPVKRQFEVEIWNDRISESPKRYKARPKVAKFNCVLGNKVSRKTNGLMNSLNKSPNHTMGHAFEHQNFAPISIDTKNYFYLGNIFLFSTLHSFEHIVQRIIFPNLSTSNFMFNKKSEKLQIVIEVKTID